MRFTRVLPLTGCIVVIFLHGPCQHKAETSGASLETNNDTIQPVIITEPVAHDTDDPAIWINRSNLSESLVIGTDKDSLGALYVYDLDGKILQDKIVKGLSRPNNVDVEYDFDLNGKLTDIAIVTERFRNRIRIFSLPDFKPLDNGGISVFEGEKERSPMGIAIYRRAADRSFFAIVGRKTGPSESYLWQYQLQGSEDGNVVGALVRKFGRWSGKEEIESIAVDDELGYVYYSDERHGIRKYYADPEKGNAELALFGITGFAGDQEGISIYEQTDSTGYILVSDQQASRFHIFSREGDSGNPHDHKLLTTVQLAMRESDGSEVTRQTFDNRFPGGLFVAMSHDRTFHYYSWDSMIADWTDITR